MSVKPETLAALEAVVATIRGTQDRPHGPATSGNEKQVAGNACVQLCGGDQDRARSLWKLIAAACDGYMPRAAAIALIYATKDNIGPDVTAPDPGGTDA